MRHAITAIGALASLIGTSASLAAQSLSTDSAGVRIVSNAAPAWRDRQSLRVDSAPQLVIPSSADSTYRFRQVRSVMRLGGGEIAVVDAASTSLTLFGRDGHFMRAHPLIAGDKGRPQQIPFVRRLHGDTIAVANGFSTLALFTHAGAFVRSIALPSGPGPAGRHILLDVLWNGSSAAAALPQVQPRAAGTRWVDTTTLRLFSSTGSLISTVGALPYAEFEQRGTEPRPRWLSPIGVIGAGADRVYAGFGDRYEIRVSDGAGTLRTIIRRAWTPTPITADDWAQWVIDWSKRWITSTGADREREMQAVRDSPYASALPAFSQFLVDRRGWLWVREARWQDATSAGSLTDVPLVPSSWSVFDGGGQWLCDVRLPARFQPLEIGEDYVAGWSWQDGATSVTVYGLRTQPL